MSYKYFSGFLLSLFLVTAFYLKVDAQTMVPAFADVSYTGSGHTRHLLDVYVPKKVKKKAPAVVFIHGGAWLGGSKKDTPAWSDTLYKSGFVIVGINYRLSQDSIFPAQIYDCKTAIRFLKLNAKKYNIDPKRIGVMGMSAGGHLVALLGSSHGEKELEGLHLGNRQADSRVHAVMDVFGPSDFLQMDAHLPATCNNPQEHNAARSPESRLIGCQITSCPEKVAKANPITYVNGNEPPFAIHHGLADCIVPSHQSTLLYNALVKTKTDVTVNYYKGVGHGGGFWHKPSFDKIIVDFFTSKLKK